MKKERKCIKQYPFKIRFYNISYFSLLRCEILLTIIPSNGIQGVSSIRYKIVRAQIQLQTKTLSQIAVVQDNSCMVGRACLRRSLRPISPSLSLSLLSLSPLSLALTFLLLRFTVLSWQHRSHDFRLDQNRILIRLNELQSTSALD